MASIIIKSVLSVLLLLCILHMPYVYYTILRFAVTISMVVLQAADNQEKSFKKLSFFVFVGVLFNPLFPVEFERIIWVVIDILLAAILIVMSIKQFKEGYF
jgi:hypothetical protein